jgi:hypothetical protein
MGRKHFTTVLKGVEMSDKLKPGDYVGMYIDDRLIYTGVLKDIGIMESGRTIYQILLVKNIFQRNFPEIHFSDKADVRPVGLEKIKAEVSRLKIALQQHLEKMENDVPELISEKELHSIIG